VVARPALNNWLLSAAVGASRVVIHVWERGRVLLSIRLYYPKLKDSRVLMYACERGRA